MHVPGLAFFGAGLLTLVGLWLAWRALHLKNVDAAG
jgi:hypothetical protein